MSLVSIRRIFQPTPFDAMVIVAVAFWTACAISSVEWYGEQGMLDLRVCFLVFLVGAMGSLAAIGSALAHRQINGRSACLLLPVWAVGFIFFLATGWLTTSPYPTELLGRRDRFDYFRLGSGWLAIRVIVILAGSFLIPYMGTRLIFLIGRSMGKIGRTLMANRTRNLIVFAIVLFGLAKLQNLIGWSDGSGGGSAVSAVVEGLFSILFMGVVVWLAVYVPGRLLTSRKWFTAKFISASVLAVTLAAAIGMFAIDQPWPGFSFGWVSAVVMLPFVYLFSFLACSVEPKSAASESAKIDNRDTYWIGRPSIWSLLFTIPLVAALATGYYFYDPALLIGVGPNSSVSTGKGAPGVLELAAVSRQVIRKTGGGARLVSQHPGAFWMIDSQRSHDPDFLKHLPAATFQTLPHHLVFKHINPSVDMASLRNWKYKSVGLCGGKLSNQQLDDLFVNLNFVGFCGPVELPEQLDPAITVPTLYFFEQENFPIAPILDRLINRKDNGQIIIFQPLTIEDWDAVVRASEFRKVKISGALPPGILQQSLPPNSLRGIGLEFNAIPKELESWGKFIRHTGISASFRGGTEQERWENGFAFPQMTDANWKKLEYGCPSDDEFKDRATRFRWAFGWNENENITKVWIPESLHIAQHIKVLGDVETLRMDVRGINGVVPEGSGLVDGKDLARLSKLKRCYLPAGVPLDDLKFLGSLNDLEHLQIQAQDRTVQVGTGFEVCTNLKSLRIFGTPDAGTLAELSRLGSLKQVVIIDDDGRFKTPELVKAIQAKLPKVDVQVIQPEDFQAETGSDFESHVKMIRERLSAEARTAVD